MISKSLQKQELHWILIAKIKYLLTIIKKMILKKWWSKLIRLFYDGNKESVEIWIVKKETKYPIKRIIQSYWQNQMAKNKKRRTQYKMIFIFNSDKRESKLIEDLQEELADLIFPRRLSDLDLQKLCEIKYQRNNLKIENAHRHKMEIYIQCF